MGIRRGDTVAIMLTNRPEFQLFDTAAMHLGAVSFSIYNTSSPEQIAHMLRDANCRLVFVEGRFIDRAKAGASLAETVETMIVLDGQLEGGLQFEDFENLNPEVDFDFDATWRKVQSEDLLTLIYTSGTTGPPKGVEITHANVIAQCRGIDAVLHPRTGGAALSFLPSAHVGDRVMVHYSQMFFGSTLTCCPDLADIFSHIVDARPTTFASVPRIWEKMKSALELEIEADPEHQEAYQNAIALGIRKVRAEQAGESIPAELQAEYDLAEMNAFSKIRERLGFDRCEVFLIGAAPPGADVLEFFAAIGIYVTEIWGMSETAGTVTIVPPDKFKLGTVGPPMPGLEVMLADDGEALVRGPTVMRAYRNLPDKTAETIIDGWLRTGDLATIDSDGFLKIVGRKKDIIISSSGKNMSPTAIELKIMAHSSMISHVVVVGDAKPYNVALIVLPSELVIAFAKEHGIAHPGVATCAVPSVIQQEIESAVERANRELSRPEQIKQFKILIMDWLPGGEELTPTMKVKRQVVLEKYKTDIGELYGMGAV